MRITKELSLLLKNMLDHNSQTKVNDYCVSINIREPTTYNPCNLDPTIINVTLKWWSGHELFCLS